MYYQVWTEGYSATGDFSKAILHGTVESYSFKDACDSLFAGNPEFNGHKGQSTYSSENLTLWGCRLFDNEIDARKAFG